MYFFQPSINLALSILSFSFSFKRLVSRIDMSSQEEEQGMSSKSWHEVEPSTIATLEIPSLEDGVLLGTFSFREHSSSLWETLSSSCSMLSFSCLDWRLS